MRVFCEYRYLIISTGTGTKFVQVQFFFSHTGTSLRTGVWYRSILLVSASKSNQAPGTGTRIWIRTTHKLIWLETRTSAPYPPPPFFL